MIRRALPLGGLLLATMLSWGAVAPASAAPVSPAQPVAGATQDPAGPAGSVPAPPAAPIAPVRPTGQDLSLAGGTLQPGQGTDIMPLADLPSREIATNGATLVGVTWQSSGPDSVEIRSQSPTSGWSPWRTLDIADPARGTDPIWVGDADRVQVRAARAGTSVVDRLTLATVKGAPVPGDATVSGAALADQPATVAPTAGRAARSSLNTLAAGVAAAGANTLAPVISRAQWGADETLRSNSPSYASTVRAIAIHHTATTNSYTATESASIIRSIYRYHTVSLGWNDLGYNVVVDRFGQVFEGRAGGLTLPTIGAHVLGYNSHTMGIGMLGDNSSVQPTAVQREAVAQVAAWKLFGTYRANAWGIENFVSPEGEVTRFPPGTPVQVHRIFAHREVNLTTCPGDAGYALMPALRDRVNAIMATKTATPIQTYWEGRQQASPLGDVTRIETPYGQGSWATFSGGAAVTDHPAFGFRVLPKSLASGWPGPQLGWPTQSVRTLPDGRGQAVDLVAEDGYGSTLIAGPRTSAAWVGGPIRDKWLAMGGVTSTAGYPTRSQGPVGDRVGAFAEFQDGSILWSAATGAQWLSSVHRAEWWRRGGAVGPARYPTRSSAPVGDSRGSFAEFQEGSILSTPTTGTHWISSTHRAEWWRLGGALSPAGYPTRASGPVGDGRGTFAEFEDGSILSTATTGTRWMGSLLRARWWASGGAVGLGYPSGSQVAIPGGVSIALESNVSLVGSATSGVFPLCGPIRDRWAVGGVAEFGLPNAEPVNLLLVPGGYSTFSNGSWIVWGPQSGARKVPGPILNAWFAKGGAAGYGLPVAEATLTNGVQSQQFQGGLLTAPQ